MLQMMRAKAGGVIAKIILVLLVGSFALWGVADYVADPGNSNIAATIGGETVSVMALSRQYRSDLAQSQLASLDPDMQRNLNFAQISLDKLINSALIESEAKALRLELGEQAVVELIKNAPDFQNEQGNFDPARFENQVLASGFNEAGYLDQLTSRFIAQQMISLAAPQSPIFSSLADILFQRTTAKRDAIIVTLDDQSIAAPSAPNDGEISAYYEENKEAFRTPEYRNLSYIWLNQARLMPSIIIDDAIVRSTYDQTLASYTTPESRNLIQIQIDDDANAQSIIDALNQQNDPDGLVRQGLIDENAIADFGAVARGELPDIALEDAAFALPTIGATPVIEGLFGKVIIYVSAISAAKTEPFDAVKAAIKTRLAAEEALRQIPDLILALEDELGRGASLDDAASALAITLERVNISKNGESPAGNRPIVPAGSFLNDSFTLETGETGFVSQNDNGDAFVMRVDNITQSTIPDLAEVRPRIIDAMMDERRDQALEREGEIILNALNDAPNDADGVIAAISGALDQPKRVQIEQVMLLDQQGQNQSNLDLDDEVVGFIFDVPPSTAAQRPFQTQGTTEFKLVYLLNLHAGDKTAQADIFNASADAIASRLQQIRYGLYLNALKQDYDIEINAQVVDRVY